MMAAAAVVVYLPGGIVALLPHPFHTDLVDGAASGEPLILVIGQWRHLDVVFRLGGLVFGDGHRQAGSVEG
jgi:hypothetical protein